MRSFSILCAALFALAATSIHASTSGRTLGQIGYDDAGRSGRIHLVVPGDTLWDITDLYLGTPWIWPSIWQDNQDIENPHLIRPGDRIWITAGEMRRLSPTEVDQFLSNVPIDDALPAEIAAPEDAGTLPPKKFYFGGAESAGFVSVDEMQGATTIVASPEERIGLAATDHVFIGFSGGEVENGDQFTIIKLTEDVVDPETDHLFGHLVEVLGWLEVTDASGEAAAAVIRVAHNEVQRGYHLVKREPIDPELEVREAPDGVRGSVLALPARRAIGGTHDLVYLNRGRLHGLVEGHPLEIYREGEVVKDELAERELRLPSRVVAKLLVIDARRASAVAVVTSATSEFGRGDFFRGATD